MEINRNIEVDIKEKLKKNPDDLNLQLELADLYYDFKDFKSAQNIYEKICRKLDYEIPNKYYAKLEKIYRLVYSRKEKRIAWKKLNTENEKLAEECYQLLLSGEIKRAKNNFTKLLNKISIKESAKKIWIESFTIISQLFDNDFKLNRKKRNSHCQINGKVIVSGMGWSGSGALFDYFREFKNVYPIIGEQQVISGNASIRKIRNKSIFINTISNKNCLNVLKYLYRKNDGIKQFGKTLFSVIVKYLKGNNYNIKLLKKEILFFFSLGLFGFGAYDNWSKRKNARLARKLVLSDAAEIYADNVKEVCVELVDLVKSKDFTDDNYIEITEKIIKMMTNTENQTNSIFLFNNIIPMNKIDIMDIISNSKIFCTVRDPRSNYVALVRENLTYTSSVESFIKRYRKRRLKFEKSIKVLERNKKSVNLIQFEKFVISENYRKQLALEIGLDLSEHKKHTYFKPWESEKNVFLHKKYENQEEIRLIEKELPEYCVNIDEMYSNPLK